MTVYLWKIPENYPDKLIGVYESKDSPNRFLFRQGKKLSKDELTSRPIIKFAASKKQLEQYDCLCNTSTIPLVSERLANLLYELTNNDIQFFDAKVECIDGELQGYKILNVIHAIKCIDHERSSYTMQELPRGMSIIGDIKKLVYKSGCMGGHELARDEECKGHLLASQVVYDAFKREKIAGAWLATPDEFYNLVRSEK